MKGLRQFGSELSAIIKNRKVLIPVIAILMVPVLYSGLFLGAFWDPYSKMDELPVAVVNSDAGAELNGKQLAIGDQFINKLKDNPRFKWDFVDKEAAEQGLRDNRYYMAIEIPENFSAQAATLTSDKPAPAVIRYLPNESLNFLSAQIGNTAIETMKAQLNKEVTKEYARTVFEQVTVLADGLGAASDGATQINDGTLSAKDGAATIAANLAKLSDGSLAVKNGVNQLVTGSSDLEKGAKDLNKGIGSLSSGLNQLAGASGQLQDGAAKADKGAKQLEQGLKQSAAGSAQVAAGADQLSHALEQYAAAVPGLADDANFKQMVEQSKKLAAGAKASADGQQQLSGGAASLTGGLDKLAAGMDTFGSKLQEASAGGQKLAAGSGSLQAGAAKLHGGLNQLSAGVATVADGSSQLATGANQLSSGLVQLTDGTGELSSKLSEAASKTSTLHAGDDMFDMFASPIDVETVIHDGVPNYGTGFAPYFISLGLFVGALLLTIVFAVREPAVQPASGWSWFVSKLLVMAGVGLIQTVIVDAVLLYGLDLHVQNVGQFFLFSFITSITFMSLIQFLVTVFDQPGRFIAIVVLIFQLTTSAGTFPLELIPGWMQAFNAWLPMSYTVSGFKAVISSGDASVLWSNTGVLLLFFAIFSLLTLAYFVIVHRKHAGNTELTAA
ncbi:YhgE/Pip domain-containing protein [Paenibacillus gorillae]|uniref:YhgE/Pip domain-containing protein n=1 Tax=Paenibacillus gorillae TaxID=1243662 RepID=UPI0004B2C618|nr:YhgE/Pip domain-containing protein [Paenibacillus gorillae]